MARLGTLQTTEAVLAAFVSELSREPETGESFVPLVAVKKFSRRKLGDLNSVLNAAQLPAGVVVYDGSGYQRGRAPTRLARVAVVVRVPAQGDPEATAVDARAQMDACRDRLDEHTFGNAVVYAQTDGVVESRDGSINYFVTFQVWDH
jgi:hypothetical protein